MIAWDQNIFNLHKLSKYQFKCKKTVGLSIVLSWYSKIPDLNTKGLDKSFSTLYFLGKSIYQPIGSVEYEYFLTEHIHSKWTKGPQK